MESVVTVRERLSVSRVADVAGGTSGAFVCVMLGTEAVTRLSSWEDTKLAVLPNVS